MRKLLLAVLAIVIVLTGGFLIRLKIFGKQSREMQPIVGLEEGKLRMCFPKPNCVSSSNHSSTDHHYAPISVDQDPIPRLVAKAKEMGMEIQTQEDAYFYATHESKIFGFIDDVEVHYRPDQKSVEFRSASRVGHSDLGANRKRLDELTSILR